MSQISSLLSNRPQGSLPSNMEVNPKENVKVITLKSEKVLARAKLPERKNLAPTETGDENSKKEKEAGDIQSQSSASRPKSLPGSRTLEDSQTLQGPTEKSVIKPYILPLPFL